MATQKYNTVSEELLHVAEAAAEYFSGRGFSVGIERQDLGFPYCPTARCKRGHTTYVLEVAAKLDPKKMAEWVAYGKSCGQDLRISYVLPSPGDATEEVRDLAQKHGVGLFVFSNAECEEVFPALDLSLNVELPPIAEMPAQVRQLLGLAYDHFEYGDWREGFEAAAQSLESAARRYLKRHLLRFTFQGKPVTKTAINKMTLGGLARTFDQIQNQNVDDKQIGQTLDAINKDRIGVVHHRGRARAERRLRQNVGRHMWAICAAMRHVVR